jgi:hypothetical protein
MNEPLPILKNQTVASLLPLRWRRIEMRSAERYFRTNVPPRDFPSGTFERRTASGEGGMTQSGTLTRTRAVHHDGC